MHEKQMHTPPLDLLVEDIGVWDSGQTLRWTGCTNFIIAVGAASNTISLVIQVTKPLTTVSSTSSTIQHQSCGAGMVPSFAAYWSSAVEVQEFSEARP